MLHGLRGDTAALREAGTTGGCFTIIIIAIPSPHTFWASTKSAYHAALVLLCARRGDRASWCIASSRTTGFAARTKGLYSSWLELAAGLDAMLTGATQIAMQYSPTTRSCMCRCGRGDSGFLRGLGKQIVSRPISEPVRSVLNEEQMATHAVAQKAIDQILEEGWKEIGRQVRPSSGLRRTAD